MKKALIILLAIVAAVIVLVCVGSVLLMNRYRDDPTFMGKTTLNGEKIDGTTPEEIADEFAKRYDTAATQIVIRENGAPSITGTLQEFGYDSDRASFLDFLTRARDEQRDGIASLLQTLFNGTQLELGEAYICSESALPELVQGSKLAVPRVETVDPAIYFDEDENRYHVVPGSEGNMIDDAALQKLVRETLDAAVAAGSLPPEITIDIPQDVYTSVPPADIIDRLQAECDEKNLELAKQEVMDTYSDVEVTYVFGEQTEVLSHDTILSWLSIDDDLVVTIDEEQLGLYVDYLCAAYDTLYEPREFHTSTGQTIYFSGGENEYGYRIDYEQEYYLLYDNIASREAVVREPVYIETNDWGNPYYYTRNGTDDLCGTYVEVNLTRQHFWFYRDGQLIVESDVVTGTTGKETQTGVFALPTKESPSTLVGEAAAGSDAYSVEVTYWMPFYEGQGLHDASWRSEFGGEIYRTNGSHGCINLPFAAAETLYFNIELGMPIIIYQE